MQIPNLPAIQYKPDISKLSNKIIVVDKKGIFGKKSPENSRSIVYAKKKRYPIRTVDKLIDNLDNHYFTARKNNVKIPTKITPRLAYFIGYLQGDGSIESCGKRINFTDESYLQLVKINNLCHGIFGTKGRIRSVRAVLSKKPCYILEIGNLVINSYLSDIIGIKKGVKKHLTVPDIVLANREITKYYIIGLYDADGTLPKDSKRCKQFFIDLTMQDNISYSTLGIS